MYAAARRRFITKDMVNYKMQMCKEIGKELGLRPEMVRYTYDLIFEHLKMHVNVGEQVVVKHFGTFEKTEKGGVKFTKCRNWKL